MPRTVPPDGPLPTVLVVDDEPLNRDLIRRVLFPEYEVREAADAQEAMVQLEEASVDILILDQLMPGRTGTELARDVRTRWPCTVALLLTGYEDTPEIDAARRDGAIFEVVGKPWLATQLRAALARALEEHRRRLGR